MDIRSVARKYAQADDSRAWKEVIFSFGFYLFGLVLALASIGNWLIMLPAMVIAAMAGLRLYMIQHDCIHRSFFTSKKLNDGIGVLLSPISMTPFKATRYIHNLHHSYVGDLERRDSFEIYTMTLNEWRAAAGFERLKYRIFRSPLTLIFVGPFILYGFLRRVPSYGLKTGVGDLVLHNLLLAAVIWMIWMTTGWAGVAVWAGSIYIATVFGALIPYVLHNFEQVHWGVKPEWDFQTAALEGSSVLDWGRWFEITMMNIGYHDLHHLNAQIPGYKLKAAYEDLDQKGLIHSEKIGFFEGVMCLQWKLYDEDLGKMIRFPAVHRNQGAAA